MASATEVTNAGLIVPGMDGDELIRVPLSQLPDDAEDVISLLTSEAAPLPLWWDFIKAYLAQNKIAQFRHLCSEASSDMLIAEVINYFHYTPVFERIQFLCAAAAVDIAAATDERDRAKKQELFTRANASLVKAREINDEEQLPHLGLGMLAAAKGDLDMARKEYSAAMFKSSNGRPNISGALALAALHYNTGKITDALALYKRALRQHPGAPAEVRLGLGACYFKLGELKLAQAAFERVLQLDPECPEAYLGMAVIKFNSANAQQGLSDGMQLLLRAYALDPLNPAVLTLLAHYCLLRGEHDKVLLMARTAYDAAESDAVKASCLTLMARAHHAVGDMQQATQLYMQASRLDSKLPLPHIGLAQMYLQSSDTLRNAASELESVLQVVPACYDALRLLGSLYHQLPTRAAQTLEHFRMAATKRPDEPEVWEMLGEMQAPLDPAGAMTAYTKALEIHRARQREAEEAAARQRQQLELANGDAANGHDLSSSGATSPYRVPSKLLNNAAVIMYRAGKVREAQQLLAEATANQEAAECEGAGLFGEDGGSSIMGWTPLHKLTLAYNVARLQEAVGELKAATKGYKDLLAQFPGYINCYLRLACIAYSRGDTAGAVAQAQQALDREGGHADARALLGALHLERRDWAAAKSQLKRLISEDARDDTYGELALANLYFYTQPRDSKSAKQALQYVQSAAMLYRKVLARESANIYAANGLGAILAEQGALEAAREVFVAVQEAVASSGGFLSFPEVGINLANCYLAQQDYVSAIKMYTNTSNKFHNKNVQVLLYLARAYYDSHDLVNARRTLLRAHHLAPGDFKLCFNIAVTLQQWAVGVFNAPRPEGSNAERRLEEYNQAGTQLQQAVRFFTTIRSRGAKRTGIDDKKVDSHISYCSTALQAAEGHIAAAAADAEAAAARRRLQQESAALAAQRAELDARRLQLLKQAAEEERERQAKAASARTSQLIESWRQNPVGDTADGGRGGGQKKKKRKKGAAAEEEEFADFLEPEHQGGSEEPQQQPDEHEELEETDADALRRAGLVGSSDDEGPDDRGVGTAEDHGEPGGAEDLFGGSDDDEAAVGTAQEGSDPGLAAANGAPGSRGGTSGRLKKRTAEEDADGTGAGSSVMLDDAGEDAAADMFDDVEEQPSTKRQRKSALVDSDDELGAEPDVDTAMDELGPDD